MTYYKSEWHRKITKWAVNFRTFPHANYNTNGALDRYHGTFKAKLKRDKANVQGRTISWLLVATMRLESFYWCTSGQKFQGRIRNHKIEELVQNTIHKTRAIPDCDIILMEHEGQKFARVKSVFTLGKEHIVANYD